MESPWRKIFSSLVLKQSLALMTGIGLVFLVIFFMTRRQAIELLSQSTTEQAAQIGLTAVNRMDQTFLETMRIAELFASGIGEKKLSEDELRSQMERILTVAHQGRQEILALAVAYDPEAFGGNGERMRLVMWDENKTKFIPGGNYLDKSWYVEPRNNAQAGWQEPFVGDFVKEPIAIYSVPFYETLKSGEKRFAGVVCVDLSLAWLQNLVEKMAIPDSGYAFLLSQSGRIVVHPNKDWVFVETIFTMAEQQASDALRSIGEKMVKGESGRMPFLAVDGRKLFVDYRPMCSTGWSLGILFPEHDLFLRVGHLEQTFLFYGILGTILLLMIIIFITIGITRPLKQLSRSATEIGQGNLSTVIPNLQRQDEIGMLSRAFSAMQESLGVQMENLRRVTADKEKIESELKVAQEIQKGILPGVLPPFPQCEFFEIYASLNPAKEVGGDLYDFFMLTPEKVCLVIGDVSGKGVPASLFMAVTQTLHRGLAHEENLSPGALVEKMNQALCNNNNAGLFVTYVFAILDLESGIMTYCNAGHNPFLLLKSDGSVTDPTRRHGIPLGVLPDRSYQQSELPLEIGDTLFFY
ncbi:MAG: SpoIIE family protein phosphatase, partial [Victivallaceae bacterium]